MSLKNRWTAALLGVATLGAAFVTSAAAQETQTAQTAANVEVARVDEAGEKPAVRGATSTFVAHQIHLAQVFNIDHNRTSYPRPPGMLPPKSGL